LALSHTSDFFALFSSKIHQAAKQTSLGKGFFHLFSLFAGNRRDEKMTRSGVDVTLTIFCDFCHFLAKKLAFFSKTNVVIKFMHKIAVV
jgi:hypothetical protein